MHRILIMTALLLSAKTTLSEGITEAIIRSGNVVNEHNVPHVLIPGSQYSVTWSTTSYVPIEGHLRVDWANGSSIVAANTTSVADDLYILGSYESRRYEFSANLLVPSDVTPSRVRIGFYHSLEGDTEPKKMFGLLSSGSVERPYGEGQAKQFYTNVCRTGDGGQCVEYVRTYFGGDYSKMPALCSWDCSAATAWSAWDFGYGRGSVPKINAVMVLAKSSVLADGHVAVVTSIKPLSNGTFELRVQESNWQGVEQITCDAIYTYDSAAMTVKRSGSTRNHPALGFIYSGEA